MQKLLGRHSAITPPLCDACGDPLPRPTDLCPLCLGRKRVIDRSRAVGEYDGTLREIIHAFKYSGRRSLAGPIASLMRVRGTELLDKADYVVPVPLHWRREYHRGFNQARELARHLDVPLADVLVEGATLDRKSSWPQTTVYERAGSFHTAQALAFQIALNRRSEDRPG